MVKRFWFRLAVLLLSGSLYAQSSEPCATMQVDSARRASYAFSESLDQFEDWLQVQILAYKNSSTGFSMGGGATFTIPVIVHVIHDGEAVGVGDNLSQAQVNSQIDVLNEDFRRLFGTPGYNTDPDGADSQIEFCLAVVDEFGTPLAEPGINRVNRNSAGFSAPPYTTGYIDGTIKPATYWDPDQYFNVWTCDISGSILGYAQFPETDLGGMSCASQPASTDGVVCLSYAFGRTGTATFPFDGGRTMTHEVGHYLGLRHIWGDGGCGVDDYCSDTPDFRCTQLRLPNRSCELQRNGHDRKLHGLYR